MTARLEGKIIAISGAASGIGLATAKRIASEGAIVAIGDLNTERAAQAADEITASGGTARAYSVDIGVEEQIQAFIDSVASDFGGLDGLFNNAADLRPSMQSQDTDAVTIPNDIWWNTLTVNLTGYMWSIRYAVPHLLARGGGSIVNTVSDAVYLGEPVRLAYAVSKAGIEALSKNTASRWGKQGIRSNCVAPGVTLTPGGMDLMPVEMREWMLSLMPAARLGTPDDQAAVAAMLLSDDSAWMTGQTIRVNGGNQLGTPQTDPRTR
ncbi:SDR family oxidoreductase [Herbiconiux moechotypicola]|uniref:Glucose 1-dehydrogenase n=1 Tax=Herbiconiux moechotypicola TaxID=637393 RepID=A0ABN3E1I7_9MICO|nr:SDR family oxidoreductase [Herbiconiux moechotypicola]MCS5731345.1 SDR family oxidoreductase [Herbiconiux moechotypicola]